MWSIEQKFLPNAFTVLLSPADMPHAVERNIMDPHYPKARSYARGALRYALLALSLTLSLPSFAAVAEGSAAALRAKYASLRDQLARNQFQRPIYLDSSETKSNTRGNIYAVMDHPFSEMNAALNGPQQWCDILILHINTKYCRAEDGPNGTVLKMNIGKKYDQPLDQAYRLEFNYKVIAATPDYLQVQLTAGKGPMGTSDYLIVLETVSLPQGRSFLHLTYAYGYGLSGRIALQAYLATAGSGKVGFTVVGNGEGGEPEYIRGVRGVVERNTMRYYLAIDAYLNGTRLDKRLENWYEGTERYPRQLHEVDKNDYLQMKRREYQRQQSQT